MRLAKAVSLVHKKVLLVEIKISINAVCMFQANMKH